MGYASCESQGSFKVIYGSADGVFSFVGVSVGSLKASLVNAFNIPKEAIAFVNGERVGSDHQMQAGQVLEFCKQFGQKGMNRMLTESQIRSEYGLPPKVLGELLQVLKPVAKSEDGQLVYLESFIDKGIENLCSRFAPPDDSDHLIPPEGMLLGGNKYDGLTALEYHLMELLIEQTTVSIQDTLDHVYGHHADKKENALTQIIKRLNQKFLKKSSTFIEERNGRVTLVR